MDMPPIFAPLSLALVSNLDGSSCSEESSQADDQTSPTISESYSHVPGYASSVTSSTTIQSSSRKPRDLSHVSESDRRSEFSYRSESISLAVSEHNVRVGSKFKVVKLGDKVPYVRGRFICFDFHDIPNRDGGSRMDAVPAVGSRIPTPLSVADLGAGGKLTSTSALPGTGLPMETVGVMDGTESGLPVAGVQAENALFHNLHHSSALPIQLGVVQRSGTLVLSPILPKSVPSFPLLSKSLLPPHVAQTNSTPGSPEPSRVLPIYSADGTPKESTPLLPSSSSNSPPDTHHSTDYNTRKGIPFDHSPSAGDVGLKRPFHVNPDLAPAPSRPISTSSPAPSGSGTPSRKISGVAGPDPTRLLRMKGDMYIAEMIDRVWESASRNNPSMKNMTVTSGLVENGGFDRIEAKISQCMSLVTEHVLRAVHGDLDSLAAKAKTLRERAASLEYENHALRTENVLLRNAVNNPLPASATPTVVMMNGSGAGDVAGPSRSRMKL